MQVKAVFKVSHEEEQFRKRRDAALEYREEPLHAGVEQEGTHLQSRRPAATCFDARGDGTGFGVYEFL